MTLDELLADLPADLHDAARDLHRLESLAALPKPPRVAVVPFLGGTSFGAHMRPGDTGAEQAAWACFKRMPGYADATCHTDHTHNGVRRITLHTPAT